MKTDNVLTTITGAIVIRSSLKDWDSIKEYIRDNYPNTKIIFQKTALGPLEIISKTETRNRGEY